MEQLIHLNKIASLYICRSPAVVGEDKLAGSISTKDNNTLIPSLATSRALITAPAKAHSPTPDPQGIYTNIDLQRATKLALKFFLKGQEYGKANFASRNRALKAQNPSLYNGSSHIECYYFY